jgi:hypothetical protein
MWPKLLDLSREDSKRILRRVELDAYSGVVSAFRAQGDLSKDKKKLLQDLQHILRYNTIYLIFTFSCFLGSELNCALDSRHYFTIIYYFIEI